MMKDTKTDNLGCLKRKMEKAVPLWFNVNAMTFFNSQLHDMRFIGNTLYFISSELRDVNNNFTYRPAKDEFHRRFSIRKWTVGSKEIDTIGEFQGYSSLEDAKKGLDTIR